MSQVSRVFNAGIEKIMKEDKNTQRKFLETLSEIRYMNVDYLLSIGCFFVPNADYLLNYFGDSCLNIEYDLYNYEGDCKWVGHLMIPIRDLYNNVVGFTGYNPLSKLIENENKGEDNEVPPRYIDSSKNCFDRNKFMLIPNGYDKFLSSDYVFVLDGVFDALTLASLGYNACSNLGTNLSDECIFLLSFPKRRYIPADNDLAGLSLLNTIQRKLPNSVSVTQMETKDIDEYVNKFGIDKFRNKVDSFLESKNLVPIVL